MLSPPGRAIAAAHMEAGPAPERRTAGILLRLGSASSFAVMGACLKLAGDHGVNAPEMIFYRNVFGLPVVLGWILAGPGLAAIRTARPLAHVTRAGIGLVSMLFTFQALVMLPLAEATTVTFTAPIFATIFSALLLSERVGRHRWFAVLLGFAGVAVVMRPGGTSGAVPALGIAVALAAAIGQSAVAITIRQLGRTEQVAATVFWFTIATSLAGAALLPIFGQTHDGAAWMLLVVAGVFGGIGQLTMTASLRFAPVAVVAPFDYFQMLWALLLGWMIWSTEPAVTALVGAAMIASSGLYTAYREHRRHRRVTGVAPIQPVQ